MSTDATLVLWAIVSGDEKPLKVDIPLTAEVYGSDLKQKIAAERPHFFLDVDPDRMDLWVLPTTVEFKPIETLHERAQHSITGNLAKQFYNFEKLSEHLPPQPHSISPKIWVVLPGGTVRSSRLSPISEQDLPFTREQVVLKAKEHKSPSTEAELSELSRRQRPGEDDALYNGRPRALAPPPIAIYHPVFSSFSRQISATPDPTSFSEKEIETACELVTVSSNYYPDDADRRSAIADLLAEGTGQDSFLTGGPVHLSSTRHDILPDGTVLVRCRKLSPDGARAYAQFGELKNEIGKGGCDPIAQAECDYVSVYTSDVYKPVRDACCCPALLVAFAGPNVTVSGAVFPDKLVSQRLLDYMYIGPNDCRGDLDGAILRTAHLLRCLRDCITLLVDYYKNLERPLASTRVSQRAAKLNSQYSSFTRRVLSQNPPIPFFGPHFRSFQKNSTTYELTYIRRLLPNSIHRAVFKAIMNSGGEDSDKSVVVKFSQTYSKEGHELLAKVGLAPALWYCEKEESVGNLWVVVMDYVDPFSGDEAHKAKVKDDVRKAIQILHDHDLVHGDVRDPNVLSTKNGGMVIDFDWCGPINVARYPWCINMNDIKWAKGIGRGKVIKKEHDMNMLSRL